MLLDELPRALSMLRAIEGLGVRIALDDFGTGYSSLSYLHAFPFDKIKIDRSFVSNLGRVRQSAAIVCAIIGLGRGLGLPVIAEGVETEDQLAFLVREGCPEVQGYLVGEPRRYRRLRGTRRSPEDAIPGWLMQAGWKHSAGIPPEARGDKRRSAIVQPLEGWRVLRDAGIGDFRF